MTFQWAFLTCEIFTAVGFVWENPPEVCDAGHGDGQKLLHDNQGLLLRDDLVGKLLSVSHQSNITKSTYTSPFKYISINVNDTHFVIWSFFKDL